MTADLKLRVITDGDTRGLDKTARGLEDLADDADRAGKSTKGLGEEADKTSKKTEGLGRKSRQAREDIVDLDKRIVELKASLKGLNDEFAKTGKVNVTKLKVDSRELAGLERIRKQISGLGQEAKLAQIAEHEAAVKALKADYMLFPPTKVKAEIRERQVAIQALKRDLEDLGQTAAKVAKGGGEASGGILGFLTSPAGMATAAGVAPFAGAAIGGATLGVAGAGAGVAAGFAAYAADPTAVKQAIKAQTDTFIAAWKDAGRQALAPTIDSINMIGDAVRHIDLDRIIGKGAEHLKTLAAGTAEAIDFLGKGFAGFIDKADPAVKALSDGMAKLGRATSIALDKISSGAEGGGEALADLFKIAEAGVITVGTLVGWTEQLYHGLKKAGEGAGDFLASWNPMAHEVKKFVDERGDFVTVLTEIDKEAKAAADGISDMRSEAVLANDAFNDLFGTMMNVDTANLRVKQGFADLKEAAKDHKVTQDEITEKVLRQIQALQDQRQAELNTGDGSQAATDRINANYRAQLEELKKLFPALGALIDKYEELAKPLTKTIHVNVIEHVTATNEGVLSSGDLRRAVGSAYASGTQSAARGWALVGEDGPELVSFSGGEQVHTAAETASMLANPGSLTPMGSGGGQPIVINLYADSQLLRTVLINGAANRGQSVGQFLGV